MPSRADAVRLMLEAATKPVTKIEQTEPVAPRSSAGGTGQVNFGGRVRDRMTIQQNAPEITKPLDTWEQSVEKENARLERLGAESRARRAEQKAAEDRARWQKAEDARTLREAAEYNQRVRENNFVKAAIRAELADATAEEVTEVLKRVRAERCERLPAAYGIHLAALRAEKQEK